MDKWLRNNNVVRMVALAIGVLLWVVVHLNQETNTGSTSSTPRNTHITNVMVQALYDETQYSIVSIEPSEVAVTLKGDSAKIREINPGNLKIAVDLTKLTAGSYELAVNPVTQLDKGVTLEIVPNKVKVVMEEKQMKEIPVQIDLDGKPANGFHAGTPLVNPGRVYFSGPASKIDSAVIAKATVSIQDAKQNVFKKVKLAAYDKDGNEVKGAISPPVLEVEVPITLPLKTMPLQIKWIGQPAKGYAVASIQQSVEQVTVYGPQAALDRLEFYEGVEIDISNLKEDKMFSLEIPVKNKELKVEPAKLEIKVLVVPAITKKFDAIPVTLGVPGDGTEVRLVTPENGTVSVTVEGAPTAIEKLSQRDVQAVLNVGNLVPGTYELPISVSLPPFMKRLDDPGKAVVEVTAKPKPDGAKTAPPATPTPTGTATPTPTPESEAASASVAPSATPSHTAATATPTHGDASSGGSAGSGSGTSH